MKEGNDIKGGTKQKKIDEGRRSGKSFTSEVYIQKKGNSLGGGDQNFGCKGRRKGGHPRLDVNF